MGSRRQLVMIFGYGAIVDLADETHPVEVSRLTLEVHDPAHCALMVRDRQPQPAGRDHLDGFFTFAGEAFVYDFHPLLPAGPAARADDHGLLQLRIGTAGLRHS